MALFPAGASPLGAGPIVFTTGAGADFGAATASSTPTSGTLGVIQDLTKLTYDPTADTNLAVENCAAIGCSGAPVTLQVIATSSTDTVTTWPYSRVGRISCNARADVSLVAFPAAAIKAMLASDAALDTFTTSVALTTPAAPTTARDAKGNTLSVDTGRGVFGISRR
jgi:hypothetical protein